MKKRIRIFLTLALAIAVGIIAGATWSLKPFALAQKRTKSEVKDISITIKKQAEAPLILTAQQIVSTDVYRPGFDYLVTNTNQKSIRAYTIRIESIYGDAGARMTRSSLSNLIARELVLGPGQSRQTIESGAATYPEPVKEILLSLDFVEFDDGTTWGADTFKSAETLAGERAGGKAAIRYYRTKFERGELKQEDLENDAFEILKQMDTDASAARRRGFESGIGIVRNRLRRAFSSNKPEDISAELAKPFDASEGRDRP